MGYNGRSFRSHASSSYWTVYKFFPMLTAAARVPRVPAHDTACAEAPGRVPALRGRVKAL
jgi:hypothetical protein